MTKTFLLLVMSALMAVPCFAGQGTIRETDTQIIIEYWGGEDDVKTAEAHRAELKAEAVVEKRNEDFKNKQEEARAKLHDERMARAARKAARGY